MSLYRLTQLHYSDDRKGPFLLYVYTLDGRYYELKTFFARLVEYPDEEIGIPAAKHLAFEAIANKKEVRITDPGDMLVFHSVGGETLYGDTFWEDIS